jgi:hypothetical protein
MSKIINCETMHGKWQIASMDLQIVGIEKHKQIPRIASIIHAVNYEPCDFYNWNVQFYDTNGKYTGFRLKSLK